MTSNGPPNPLVVENVVKKFGERRAVDGLTLSIEPGEIIGLLGPNGAGKTTLIRAIVGLSRVSSGTVRVFGHDPVADRRVRAQIGYMPQDLAVYPDLSVRENVAFLAGLRTASGRPDPDDVDRALDAVDLSERQDDLLRDLSGGMKRRASLAATICGSPGLLLLDEPTSGVDPALRLQLWDLFRDLASRGGSILITTHHIAEAEGSDRVVFLRDGRTLATGEPQSLLDRYNAPDLERAFLHAMRDGR